MTDEFNSETITWENLFRSNPNNLNNIGFAIVAVAFYLHYKKRIEEYFLKKTRLHEFFANSRKRIITAKSKRI